MASLEKIANVLDLMAEYVEKNERDKEAAVETERQTRLDKIAAVHLQAHGEELSDTARQKLAKTDSATLDVVEEMLSKQAGAVDTLGGPAHAENVAPKTTKEAADAADQQFLSWIVS